MDFLVSILGAPPLIGFAGRATGRSHRPGNFSVTELG